MIKLNIYVIYLKQFIYSFYRKTILFFNQSLGWAIMVRLEEVIEESSCCCC